MRVLLWIILVIASFFAGHFLLNDAEPNDNQALTSNARLVNNETTTTTVEEDVVIPSAPLPEGLTAQEQHNIRLFEQAAPSVCFITTTTIRRSYYSRNVQEIPSGSGSGFVWDKDGHIVTNYHVIKDAARATVTLSDGSSYDAEVVGVEKRKDLAVLKIDIPRSELIPIPVGNSRDLRVGQNVYAIGNPFGLDQTLTTGVVSALGREINSIANIPIKDVIQTDAAINPGNSGGPLLNSSGRLIGVNTAIYSPSGASAGIGFSIPVDVVRWVVPDLIEFGKVNRPLIGVNLSRPLRNVEGAIVIGVAENSPAAAAGIQPVYEDRNGNVVLGDVIVAVNDDPIASNSDLYLALEQYRIGDQVTVTVKRDGREVDLPIRLSASAQ
ncbi:MAG: trypsin-like peptidase domain-containing protein [Bacteroidota bacterium]